jgi:hypothetical protein
VSVLTTTENTPAAWTRRAQDAADPWTACGWSQRSQAARFAKIIAELDPSPGESLLDFGCGTGDLFDHLAPGVRYLGFDWSLGMVARARKSHPFGEFTSMLRDGDTWDLVVCCGPFNLADNWSKAQTWALMRMLWARTKSAMAVSLYYGSDPACIRYPVSEVASTVAVLSDKFTLERGYLSNDLMVVLRR